MMPSRSAHLLLAVALLLLAACATAPAPAPAPVKVAAANEPRKITLFCSDKARMADFGGLGVPAVERPIDVAVTDKYIWVLFAPARLMRIVRVGEKVDVEMTVGHGDERWSTLDVDPVDGSIWVASAEKLAFEHISPDWKRETVPVKKVVGEGGFFQLFAATDALYAKPTGADRLVWRIDRTGKVLDTAFPARETPAQGPVAGIAEVKDLKERYHTARLLRDREGHVLVWDDRAGKVFQADGKGGYAERADIHWFDRIPEAAHTVKGIDVGSKDERWFLTSGPGELFYWKGRPVFLGPWATGGKGPDARVLYAPGGEGGRFSEYFETCQGHFIDRVATNATSYAALTQHAVLFGDFANAPDLP
jgi:hypothetical protein